jgi:hypothetical protein
MHCEIDRALAFLEGPIKELSYLETTPCMYTHLRFYKIYLMIFLEAHEDASVQIFVSPASYRALFMSIR